MDEWKLFWFFVMVAAGGGPKMSLCGSGGISSLLSPGAGVVVLYPVLVREGRPLK